MIELRVPGDKSLTHRALILACLAGGSSRVRHPLVSADTLSTAGVLRALGCAVPPLAEDVAIDGLGLRGLRAPDGVLDCGNSGTTARLMMGVLAGQAFQAALSGDASLRSRPMRRVTEPLARMGASFEELGEPDRLPVRVRGGSLRPLEWRNANASAQVKSALLLAGLTGGAAVRVCEPHPSRDHTERMLARLGVAVRTEAGAGGSCVSLEPPALLPPLDFTVPGDFSSAAFVVALAVLGGCDEVRVRGVGLNPGRTGMLRVLERMRADVRIADARESCGEPAGDVVARKSRLVATRIDAAEVPSLIDEIPILAALAARAEGSTVIEGAAELRVKETDRIAALVHNLRTVGVRAEERPDGLVVHGTGAPLQGDVVTHGDHRIAMAFAVLGAAGTGAITVDDPDAVAVSYPGFWRMLEQVKGS